MNTKILLILAGVGLCGASHGWDLGDGHGGGWDSGGITLGEISLKNEGFKLPTITLGHSGHTNTWSGWPGSVISGGGGWKQLSLNSYGGGWHSDNSFGHEWKGTIQSVVKEIGVPVPQAVEVKIPYLVPKSVPQPYPVLVPVSKPEPFEVVKTVVKTVEKKVPTPVEKVIPVKVEKPVPFTVYKSVPYPVVKHVPIRIPVHKTIHHYSHHHHHHRH